MAVEFERANDVVTKQCSVCREPLEIDAFSRDRGKPDGLRCMCRACDHTRRRAQRALVSASRPVVHIDVSVLPRKRCRACGEEKSVTEFYRLNAKSDGYMARCKACYRGRVLPACGENDAATEERLLRFVWKSMGQRCTNPRAVAYPNYGARGIGVCTGWFASFERWREDMGPRPPGLTLDRRDNDKGYWCGRCPECIAIGRVANCRWATTKEQNDNKRRHGGRLFSGRLAEMTGERMTLQEWADRFGLPRRTLKHRVDDGWPLDRIISTPRRSP